MTVERPDADPRRSGRLLAIGGADRLLQGLIVATAPVLFLRYTDSGIIVGLGNACHYAVWLLFGLVAGVMADVYDRARMIRISSWLRLVLVSVAATFTAADRLTIAWIIGCVSVLAASLVFTDAALNASMPALFDRHELAVVNSKLSLLQSIGGVIAPALGTLAMTVDDSWLFLLMLLPTATALIATGTRRPYPFGAPGRGRLKDRSLTAGFAALAQGPQLRKLLAGVAFLNLMGGAYLTVLPVVALSDRGTSTAQFGAALACQGVALVGTNVAIARSVARGHENLDGLLVWSFVLRVLSFATVGFLTMYSALLVSMALSGTAMALWNVPASSKVLEKARGETAGSTLTSFKMAAILWTPLGAMAGGLATSVMEGAHVILLLAGLTSLGAVCFYALARNQAVADEELTV